MGKWRKGYMIGGAWMIIVAVSAVWHDAFIGLAFVGVMLSLTVLSFD